MSFRSRLAQAIADHTNQELITPTGVDGLTLYRSETLLPRQPMVYEPSICVIAQGQKLLQIGDQSYSYDQDNYLINSVTMPIEAEVAGVTKDQPYLGLSLKIDSYVVSQLMLEMEHFHPQTEQPAEPGLVTSCALSEALVSSIVRLIECSADPMDRQVLAPGLIREIFYEVLKGPHGALLRNCVVNHMGANRIAPVIRYIEQNFANQLDIDSIADMAGMSSSSLHEHFKQATSLSPMQFVKKLRLHSAYSMLLTGNQASDAAYQVGYSSPSQFSREFKRFFGSSPSDIQPFGAR